MNREERGGVIGWGEVRIELAYKLIFTRQGGAGKATPVRPSMAAVLWSVTRADGEFTGGPPDTSAVHAP